MIHECINPVPCTTPIGDGYVWYIKPNGMWENDELTVVLCKDGSVRHFGSDQVQIWFNATYGIGKKNPLEEIINEIEGKPSK
jgi:hypothetical protein